MLISQLQKQLTTLQRSKNDPLLRVLECLSSEEYECLTEMLELRDCGFRNPDIMIMLGEEKWANVLECEARLQEKYKELEKSRLVPAKLRRPPEETT